MNFRFGFNEKGFYTGIVRRNDVGLFPSRSTEFEPTWIDGKIPIWNFKTNRWDNIFREDKSKVESNLDFLKWHSDRSNEYLVKELDRIVYDLNEMICFKISNESKIIKEQIKFLNLGVQDTYKL